MKDIELQASQLTITNLKHLNSSLVQKLKDEKDKVSKISKIVAKLESEHTLLKSENKTLKQQIENLESENKTLKDKLDNVEEYETGEHFQNNFQTK